MFTEHDVTDQSGKTFVVTGSNTGLGFHTARVLAERGARVLLACRSSEKAQAAMSEIRNSAPNANLGFVALDLNDLDSARAAATQIAAEPRLDCLINNAGLMVPPLQRTKQGFESQMGVNHLGHFALVGHLMPKILGDGTRVVSVSSLAHKNGVFDFDDLHAHNSYKRGQRYSASKLANMMFGLELDRRLKAQNASAVSVIAHPGVAATELSRYIPNVIPGAMALVGMLLNSAAQGAWPSLMAATTEVTGGEYFGPQGFYEARGKAGPAKIAGRARKDDVARKLWAVSIAATGVDPGI